MRYLTTIGLDGNSSSRSISESEGGIDDDNQSDGGSVDRGGGLDDDSAGISDESEVVSSRGSIIEG